MDLQKVGWEQGCIDLSQNGDGWRALVSCLNGILGFHKMRGIS